MFDFKSVHHEHHQYKNQKCFTISKTVARPLSWKKRIFHLIQATFFPGCNCGKNRINFAVLKP